MSVVLVVFSRDREVDEERSKMMNKYDGNKYGVKCCFFFQAEDGIRDRDG